MSSSTKSIIGLVALVTGGASGLGEGTTRRLVQQGACVVICDLPTSKGRQLAEELGDRCAFAPADVTKESEVEDAVKFVEDKFQRLDVLVNCAGISFACPIYNFEEDVPHSLKDFERTLAVNTTGTFNAVRLCAGLMGRNQPRGSDGERGVIVNVSSIVAQDESRSTVAYVASKGAIEAMTLPLAIDLAPKGIRCCTIAPGVSDTPLFATLNDEIRRHLLSQSRFPKRLVRPDDFAHLVQSVVENPMLNGCIIRIDGARRLRAST